MEQSSLDLRQPAAWAEELAQTAFAERGSRLESLILTEFRAALLMRESDALPLDESYFELGLTSLGATEVRQRLEVALGCSIDSVSLFNNPTVRHLMTYLREDVLRELFRTDLARARPGQAQAPVVEDSSSGSPARLLHELLQDLYEP